MLDFKNPQDFKDGNLIMGKYRPKDLVIFSIGLVSSMSLLLITLSTFKPGTVMAIVAVIALLPGLVSLAFVAKLPGFHNVFEYFKIILNFYTRYERKFMWTGVQYDEEKN